MIVVAFFGEYVTGTGGTHTHIVCFFSPICFCCIDLVGHGIVYRIKRTLFVNEFMGDKYCRAPRARGLRKYYHGGPN